MNNKTLNRAKVEKNDEYFTFYDDVEKELQYYKYVFCNKIVYCNCDTLFSNFWKYFHDNFDILKLKELIASSTNSCYYTYNGRIVGINDINSKTNSFDSKESLELLKYSDIVVTNPPFSLFREFVDILIAYNKKFIIIGNLNAIKYKNIFKYFMENKIWTGVNEVHKFYNLNKETKKFGNVLWYTNINSYKGNEYLELTKSFSFEEYPKYDNCDIIEVSRTKNIPYDYNGLMGVPISFITKYNPNQFEIVGMLNSGSTNEYDLYKPMLNGKQLYPRLVIKRKQYD